MDGWERGIVIVIEKNEEGNASGQILLKGVLRVLAVSSSFNSNSKK
jgi:hypothetical protein